MAKKIKVVLDYLGEIEKHALAQLPASRFELVRAKRVKKDEAERKANLAGADAVYFRGDDFYSDFVLRGNPNLKLAVYGGTGYQQYIDVDAATKHGIAVIATPGLNANAVAEYAVAMALDAVRKVSFYNSDIKNGKKKILVTNEISALKIGLIGHGNINRRVDAIFQGGFGADVRFWDYADKTSTPLNRILKESDIVIIAITENAQTRGFLNKARIAMMKKGAVLINPARPGLVDANALYAALKSEKLSAAAFDGMPEGSIRAKLLALSDDRFIASPHIAARTLQALHATDMAALKSIAEFFKTGKSKLIINPEYKKFTI
ncbi:MAG: hypothetical protein FWF97_01915 [Alphaproteobacteria bacterium]|nr:hypothetical protein [Alphaproteobacteria bacterium]